MGREEKVSIAHSLKRPVVADGNGLIPAGRHRLARATQFPLDSTIFSVT